MSKKKTNKNDALAILERKKNNGGLSVLWLKNKTRDFLT